MIEIKKFESEHLTQAYYIVEHSLTEKYDQGLLTQISKLWPKKSFVAVSAGTVVGYIGGSQTSDNWARVLLFAIDKKFRGLGIGTRLLNAFMSRTNIDGNLGITLEIRMSNQSAMSFYRDRGFSVAGKLEGFYNNGDDALVVRRPL